MVLALGAEDLNGACFVTGGAGEREERLVHRIIHLPNTDAANNVLRPATNAAMDWHNANQVNWLNGFAIVNYEQIVAGGVDVAVARRIAYLRVLTMRNGLYDIWGDQADHHCQYAEFADTDPAFDDIPNWGADAVWRGAVRPKFMDIVCTVAYMFRVRGHHWTDEMDARYDSLWRKCLYNEDNPGVSWEHLAHNTLHAIYPDNLDDAYLNCVLNQTCSGALAKRVDAYPAGMAGISALASGVNDIKLVVPRAFDYMLPAVQHLEDILTILADPNNRWAGSINRRLYAANHVRVNEALLASLAALVLACNDMFVQNSVLAGSQALKRFASNAPVTGGVVARMVRTAVTSDAAAETFLPRPALPGVP